MEQCNFMNPAHRLTIGHSAAKWVTMPHEALVMRAAVAFAIVRLAAVGNRAYTGISHFDLL
jgi:hypothetical protein